jgi:hypothetical protein
VESKDQEQLMVLIEVIMSVVINCDEKEYYIGQILNLEEQYQDEIQPLIERSMALMSLEMSDAQSQITDSTVKQELQMAQEKHERQ